jgi:hypothetical protein
VVLGGMPVLDESAPECVAAHARSITACSTTRVAATRHLMNAPDSVPVLPWLCTAVCTPVIGNVMNRFYLTATYARMLSGVLEHALLADAADRGARRP